MKALRSYLYPGPPAELGQRPADLIGRSAQVLRDEQDLAERCEILDSRTLAGLNLVIPVCFSASLALGAITINNVLAGLAGAVQGFLLLFLLAISVFAVFQRGAWPTGSTKRQTDGFTASSL